MTISAQVIDTIVEWIDDNLHQPLRIDDIARHAGYSKWHLQRLFLQYKGESLGRYIRERKLLLAARDLRDTDQPGLRYLPEVWLRFATDLYPRLHPDLLICRRAPTVKRTTVAPTEARPSWFSVRAKTSDATPSAAPDTQWRPVLEPQTKQHRIKLVEIHHMECLNQLFTPTSGPATARATANRRASQEQDPGCFYLTVKLGWISYNQG